VPPRLTPPEVKRELLAGAGITHLVELPPSHDVLDLSAEAFWEILRDETRPSYIVEGETFNFGKGRSGTIERLREWSARSSVTLQQVGSVSTALLDLTVAPISSSAIRWLLQNGRARDASIALGRAYMLRGRVVLGFQRGRTIGVPTANLDVHDQLIPQDGVYAGRVIVEGKPYTAAVSIGTMPTFGGDRRQIEAHLIGFNGDLYNRILDLELIDWLRDQFKFSSIDSLKRQLARDIEEATARVRSVSPGHSIASLEPAGMLM
jgi:riboflavin kinase/FMN adenylyltransferase